MSLFSKQEQDAIYALQDAIQVLIGEGWHDEDIVKEARSACDNIRPFVEV